MTEVELTQVIMDNILLITLLSAWSLVWKGIALWISARKKSKAWFIVLLIVNALGILEILYIFWFSKLGKKKEAKQLEAEKEDRNIDTEKDKDWQ